MDEAIASAKTYAGFFRFSGDRKIPAGTEVGSDLGHVRTTLYQNELLICDAITPGLQECIRQVCLRLRIPLTSFEAFVYSSDEVQASCLARGQQRFLLRFSSALIDLLDENEFKFVVGHEIAHFLFEHDSAVSSFSGSIELYLLKRAQEVSADRLGFIACGSVEVATRTLMKSLSGLSSKHLRFDVRKFVEQLTLSSMAHTGSGEIFSSHPSIIVRCRGLLWFAASDLIDHEHELLASKEARKIKLDLENPN